jgi:hypothetical protein
MIHDQRLVEITALCLMLSACDAFQAVLKPPVVISWSAPWLNGGVLDEGRGRFPVPLSAWVTSAKLYWSTLAKGGSGLGARTLCPLQRATISCNSRVRIGLLR